MVLSQVPKYSTNSIFVSDNFIDRRVPFRSPSVPHRHSSVPSMVLTSLSLSQCLGLHPWFLQEGNNLERSLYWAVIRDYQGEGADQESAYDGEIAEAI